MSQTNKSELQYWQDRAIVAEQKLNAILSLQTKQSSIKLAPIDVEYVVETVQTHIKTVN